MVIESRFPAKGDLLEDEMLHREERTGAQRRREPLDSGPEVLDHVADVVKWEHVSEL